MKCKTISGHYDSVYSVAHNNRAIISKNVDVSRSGRNYYCVSAGDPVLFGPSDPQFLHEFWSQYRALSNRYWEDRAVVKHQELEKYWARMRHLRALSRAWYEMPNDTVLAWIWLLTLPLRIPCGIYITYQQRQAKKELEEMEVEILASDMWYKAQRLPLRQALWEHDKELGTKYLQRLDRTVREMSEYAYGYTESMAVPMPPPRYATIEEIYDKVYEAGFRDFQKRQRPCRRYDGTYLEQIREKQNKADKKNRANSKEKNRTMSEAIEIVFCIGDMDNTGYRAAPEDAAKSEALLHDFCDHLMMDSHLCAVTSRELEDPNWKPPFKYGLLVLNLSLHADEATPGVHLTCIPYASGFRRGPEVQPAMGKAFAGMGYPSTWQNVLDDQGQPIPKRDKEGNRILNQDGSIRYKQEPAGQGVIDWIENQKRWLQKEMERRYQWGREYKGSHPRGNLTIPDYKAARAAERLNELELRMQIALQEYAQQIDELTENLTTQIDESFPNITEWEIICRYLNICPEEEYQEILKRADEYILSLPQEESRKAKLSLSKMIQMAQSQSSPKEKERQAKSKTPVAERENENR